MSEAERVAQVTPVLADTARRRADLYEAILTLERAAARPASDRELDWSAAVSEALDDLEPEVLEHVASTESPGGLYSEILATAPRLAHATDVLRLEHIEMRQSVAALRGRLAQAPAADAEAVERVRAEIGSLIGLLLKHRQRGADLVWQAYTLDIGDES